MSSFQSPFNADVAPKWRGSRLAHRSPSAFPYRQRRYPRSEFPPEALTTPQGAFWGERLCAGRDPCHFEMLPLPNRGWQRPGRPTERGSADTAGDPDRPRPQSTGSRQLWFGRGKGRL